uniref:Putative secreted protein n=1 Tax=Anopheles darlingi TaxID=43151 RepID=A0A2M4DKG7_ANODA
MVASRTKMLSTALMAGVVFGSIVRVRMVRPLPNPPIFRSGSSICGSLVQTGGAACARMVGTFTRCVAR